MRSISAVRRVQDLTFPRSVSVDNRKGNIHGVNDFGDDDHEFLDDENETPSDAEDNGGDEAMTKAQDKTKLKMKRSFELVLRNGHVVRFEVRLCERILRVWHGLTGDDSGAFSGGGVGVDFETSGAGFILDSTPSSGRKARDGPNPCCQRKAAMG